MRLRLWQRWSEFSALHPGVWLDVLDYTLLIACPGGAIAVACAVRVEAIAFALAGPDVRAWQWDAFASLSALAGFSLAALSIVHAAESSERVASIRSGPIWRSLVRAMLASMAAWFGAGLMALACWLFPSELATRAFLGALAAAIVLGARAGIWLGALCARLVRE